MLLCLNCEWIVRPSCGDAYQNALSFDALRSSQLAHPLARNSALPFPISTIKFWTCLDQALESSHPPSPFLRGVGNGLVYSV